MHSYDCRYNVVAGGVSSYCDSLEECVILIDYYGPNKPSGREEFPAFVWEGYPDYRYHDNGTEIIRRTDRTVPPSEVKRGQLSDDAMVALRAIGGLDDTIQPVRVAAGAASLRARKIIEADGKLTAKGDRLVKLIATFDRYRAEQRAEQPEFALDITREALA